MDGDGNGLIDNPLVQGLSQNTLVFDFSAVGPARLDSITAMDIGGFVVPGDPTSGLQSITFNLFDAAVGGNLLNSVTPPQTGVNGVAVIDLGATAGVVRMEVVITGSGSLDNIVFQPLGGGGGGGAVPTLGDDICKI